MTHDRGKIEELARSYTEAWCSREPGGLIAESRGHFDQVEYDRQLRDGVDPAG